MPKIISFLLDLVFPIHCFICGREGDYLCQDCQALFNVSEHVVPIRAGNLDGLYCALDYNQVLVKRLIQKFKYPPYIKGLSRALATLIITHFHLLHKHADFSEFVLLPVPLHKSKLRRRGFNQSEEISRELGRVLDLAVCRDCLAKKRKTQSQVELSPQEREENVKGVFVCIRPERVADRRILLVDDIYTTGATMEECARVLKAAGALQVWGVVVARG